LEDDEATIARGSRVHAFPAGARGSVLKQLIVTGDDFGISLAVNRAIEEAHRGGILNTASLMVGAPAAPDAVMRAHRLPDLRVGLHLVVAGGRPVLRPDEIPHLVDGAGNLPADLFAASVRFFFRPAVRCQLAREIRAQFEAFADTGLPLDHVNGHKHMHIHPTVLGLLLEIGRDFGLKAVRLPREPLIPSWQAAGCGLGPRLGWSIVAGPWIAAMRRRLRHAGIVANDFVFGIADSGRMTADRLVCYLRRLPEGTSEIYLHPGAALSAWSFDAPAGDDPELNALLDLDVATTIRRLGIRRFTFAELGSAEPAKLA
jgi:chitin disaccharide deacetylase